MPPHEQPLSFTDAGGRRMAGILAEPPTPTDSAVLLCHGFLSGKNSKTNLALTQRLLSKGISTYRFDWFGMGESEGDFAALTVSACLDEARQALALLATRGYRRVGVIGSSFGGLVAALAAAECGILGVGTPVLAALGLKCPVPDFPEMLRLEFGEAGMARWKQTGQIPNVAGGAGFVRLDYRFYEDCLRYDAYKAAESIRAPVVIVQGDRDEYVPVQQSRRLFEALPSEKYLSVLPGADHGFTKPGDFEKMVGELVSWMLRHLAG
jgi:pimeloyl-ACP methyl ester carboxylesterase